MIQSTTLSSKRVLPRKKSPARRPLNVERLEVRTMLAATIEPSGAGFSLGSEIDLTPRRALLEANYQTGASLFSSVVNAQRPRLAIEFEPMPGDEFAFTFEGEPIKVFVLEDVEFAGERVSEESFERFESLGRPTGIRNAISFIPSLVKFESVEETDVAPRSVRNSVPVETPAAAEIDLNVLEQTLETLSRDHSTLQQVQGPKDVQGRPLGSETTRLDSQTDLGQPGLSQTGTVGWEPFGERQDDEPFVRPRDFDSIEEEDDEGGLIELKSFSLDHDADQAPPARMSNIWHIDLQAAPASAPEAVTGPTAPIVDPNAGRVAAPSSPDGGLIKIASNQLPNSFENRGQNGLRIQLDPNVGRIRNFQLADAPGLDTDLDDGPDSNLVARWDGPQEHGAKRIAEKEKQDDREPHRVSWSGLLVAGSLLLTTSTSDSEDVATEE